MQTQSGLRARWEAACAGDTGIACFDAWAQDLGARGYLHNAARMSFASIWIFTLRLPWELGADFFLRHLADGDPASNTLSWRWVAGLHTPGKTYLTTPEIIEHVTQGRFRPAPNTLATTAEAVQGMPNPDPGPLPPVRPFDPKKPTAVILHEDDLCPDLPGSLAHPPLGTALLPASTTQTPLTMAPGVQDFRTALLEDAAQRLATTLGPVTRDLTSTRQIEDWAKDLGAAQIVTAWAPTGPVADRLDTLSTLPLHRVRRPWDSRAWPHATAGYFKFRKSIPDPARGPLLRSRSFFGLRNTSGERSGGRAPSSPACNARPMAWMSGSTGSPSRPCTTSGALGTGALGPVRWRAT